MKNDYFFLIFILTFFLCNKGNSQNNTVFLNTQTTPGLNNVLYGDSNTGLSIPSSSPNPAFNNVFIGGESGQNTFRIDPYILFSDSGSFNTFIGNKSGYDNTQGRSNCFLGYNSGRGNTTGANNVLLGYNSSNNTGNLNVVIGYNSGNINNTSNENVFIGRNAGSNHLTGNYNIFVGSNTSISNGNNNIALGYLAGSSVATSSCFNNILIGKQAGNGLTDGKNNTIINAYGGISGLTTGHGNTFLGPVITSNNALNHTFIYADPSSNQRFYIHSNGFTGIGLGNNIIPQNMLEVKSASQPTYTAINSSGLRLTNLKNSINPIANPSLLVDKGVLSVDSNGDVILVKDIGGGITQDCLTQNFIPVNSNMPGVLTCSQIFDNGTNVGIGLSNTTTNNWNYSSLSTVGVNPTPTNGVVKFDVNGVIRSNAYLATSDKKFKKDIKPIENALETLEKLKGKTYLWDNEKFKDKNLDNNYHSGFIAQELDEVLPHLVATNDNDGSKSVNYLELIPYLVEAIKEQNTLIKNQQTQIDELKVKISENFKTINSDLINFQNTKIINISPNPSNNLITISFNIEEPIHSAILQIYNLKGDLLSSLNINDRGNNLSRTLQKDNYGRGIYIAILVVNGNNIDSKKIIFE